MGPVRRKLNKYLLWFLDGPVWWAGPVLVGVGFLIAAGVANASGQWTVGLSPLLLLAVVAMVIRPRWGLAVILVTSMVMLYTYATEPGVIAGFALSGLGALWTISRRLQVEHYRALAQHDKPTCPVCGYDYAKSGSAVCTECGTNVPEYLARVRRAVK